MWFLGLHREPGTRQDLTAPRPKKRPGASRPTMRPPKPDSGRRGGHGRSAHQSSTASRAGHMRA